MEEPTMLAMDTDIATIAISIQATAGQSSIKASVEDSEVDIITTAVSADTMVSVVVITEAIAGAIDSECQFIFNALLFVSFQEEQNTYIGNNPTKDSQIPLIHFFCYKIIPNFPILTSYLNIQMSYQKKSLILQQIEQAIRKKAQQKSRTKQQVGRVLQNSIEKKKNVMRSTNTKEQKVTSIHKNQNYEQTYKGSDKHVSLFYNEQLNTLEGDLKLKKYNNRRLDKLVSLIQYMVSSSEKAIKYISSTNFEAEFALKLYRSDKQNLLNQLKNLTIEDFLDSYRANQKSSGSKNQVNYNLLLQENNKLKKDLMIMEKQAQRYLKGSFQDKQHIQLKVVEREAAKLKQTVRKLIPFESYKKYIEILQKQTKFQSMELKCQESSKKVAEIEIVIASLQTQRNAIIESINRSRGEPKSDRTYKMNQIQGEKQQLQKQIYALKARVNEMKESSKLLEQHQLLKRQNEIINEKLISLANDLASGNYATSKKSNETLVDFVKIKTKDFIMNQKKYQEEVENLHIQREQLQLLIKQKDAELYAFQQRMDNMHSQVENLRDNIEQLKSQKDDLLEKCRDSQNLLLNRENEIMILNQKLKNGEHKEEQKQDIRMKNNQLRKELQNLNKRQEEKEKWLKEKIHTLEAQKQQLEDKLMQIQQFLSHKNDEIEQLVKEKESREDSTLVTIQKIKIQAKKQTNELKQTVESLQLQLENQTFKYQNLLKTYEQSNDYYKVLTQSYNQKHQRLKELEDQLNQHQKTIEVLQELNKNITKSNQTSSETLERIKQLEMDNKHLESERERVRRQNQALNQKLRITQLQIIKNSYSLQELNNTKNENVRLNLVTTNMKREIDQMHNTFNHSKESANSLQQTVSRYQEKLRQAQNQLIFSEEAKKSFQHIIEQNSRRYQVQLSTHLKKLQEAQLSLIHLNSQMAELQQHLQNQQYKNQSHLQKIQQLQRQIQELKSEMRSLTIISNQVISQKEHSISILNNLEEEKQKLQEELDNTKQQIEDQLQINQYKAQQYTYLLRQILKGINLETTDYEHIKTFQELLEFGSKEVVEMRKRLRQEQSNRRRNNRRDQQYDFIEESDSPTFQNYKTNLFQVEASAGKNLKLNDLEQNAQKQHESDKLQLDQFQDMRSEKANESMLSEDNRCDMQEFDDLKSQKMNESMLSNKQDYQQEQSKGFLHNNDKIEKQQDRMQSQEKKQQSIGLLGRNNENDLELPQQQKTESWNYELTYKPKIISQVTQLGQFQSKISNIPHLPQTISLSPPQTGLESQQIAHQQSAQQPLEKSSSQLRQNFKIEQQQEVNSEQEQVKSQKELSKKESKQKSQVQQYIARSSDSDVVIYPVQNLAQKFSIEPKEQQKNVSGADFDQFNEMKEGMNESMMSEKPLNLSEFNELPPDNPNESFMSNKQQQSNVQLDIDQFGQLKNQQMNQSLLSEKEQEKQHGLSEFGDFKEEAMNQSMLSQKEHGLSQFGDLKEEGMNQSMVSQKDHDLEQFGNYKEEPMNQSMLSEKEEQKQHGLSQFGQLKEEMNHSMFSEKQKPQEKGLSDFGDFKEQNLINDSILSEQKGSLSKGNSQGNNLDDFQQIKSDKMNDSILSEK